MPRPVARPARSGLRQHAAPACADRIQWLWACPPRCPGFSPQPLVGTPSAVSAVLQVCLPPGRRIAHPSVQPQHLAPQPNSLIPKNTISGQGYAHAGHLKLLEEPLRVGGVSDNTRDVGEHVLSGPRWKFVGGHAAVARGPASWAARRSRRSLRSLVV